MRFLAKIFAAFKRKRSPLKQELKNLKDGLNKDNILMSDLESIFWDNGGVCCPSCGVPGFSDLVLKQERRAKRIREIQKKLKRDE